MFGVGFCELCASHGDMGLWMVCIPQDNDVIGELLLDPRTSTVGSYGLVPLCNSRHIVLCNLLFSEMVIFQLCKCILLVDFMILCVLSKYYTLNAGDYNYECGVFVVCLVISLLESYIYNVHI